MNPDKVINKAVINKKEYDQKMQNFLCLRRDKNTLIVVNAFFIEFILC
jgi:hypothetical protein